MAYSLSPLIHRWALKAAGLRGDYIVYDVDAEDARRLVRSGDWDGLNVTIPFKTLALDWCDSLTDTARRARSVNTLFRRDGKIIGDSTDGLGFFFALRQLSDAPIPFERALIVGSGGAARAILQAMRESKSASETSLASRDPVRARRDLTDMLPENSAVEVLSPSDAASRLNRFDLIVQATPVGSESLPGLPLPSPLIFKSGARVMDLIYAPLQTEFLRIAEEQGAHVQNGLPMLIGQAAASCEMWTSAVFPRERALRELLPELEQS